MAGDSGTMGAMKTDTCSPGMIILEFLQRKPKLKSRSSLGLGREGFQLLLCLPQAFPVSSQSLSLPQFSTRKLNVSLFDRGAVRELISITGTNYSPLKLW